MADRLIALWGQCSGLFMAGLWLTLRFSAVTVLLGTLFGSVICLLKMAKFKPCGWLATAYIEVIRGTPLLLQLYFFVFGLRGVGINLEEPVAVMVALVVNSSGYVAEIMRSGIQAVDHGQAEAARSLGLNGSQTMLKIVLPQAIKNILPSLANEFVMIVKETSLLSTFFIGDLMTQYRVISGARYLTIEPLIIIGIIYFIVTFILSKLVALYERRLAASD